MIMNYDCFEPGVYVSLHSTVYDVPVLALVRLTHMKDLRPHTHNEHVNKKPAAMRTLRTEQGQFGAIFWRSLHLCSTAHS